MELCGGLKLATRYVGFGGLLRGSSVVQGDILPVTGLGPPASSYKAIHGWSLPVLGLNVHGRGRVVDQGWWPPVLGPQQVSKRPQAL